MARAGAADVARVSRWDSSYEARQDASLQDLRRSSRAARDAAGCPRPARRAACRRIECERDLRMALDRAGVGEGRRLTLTSRGLDAPIWSHPIGWDALRQPGTLGIGLWETGRPRLLTADAGLCQALGRAPASLHGAAASDLEYNHPFAWSAEA